MNAVTRIDQQTTKSVTQWREWSLPDKLNDLVNRRSSLSDMPVIGPKSASELRRFAEHPLPPIARKDQIEVMLAKLSVALPKAQASEAEVNERLDLYWQALKHHALVDLHQAFGDLLRTCRFFPTIAEIEAAVKPIAGRRLSRVTQARLLLLKHDREWTPPIADDDLADPVAVKALLANLGTEANAA